MKQTIAAVAFGISALFANACFAAQTETPATDKSAAAPTTKVAASKKKCSSGKVYSTKSKKCVAKTTNKGATPATPAAPAAPATAQ